MPYTNECPKNGKNRNLKIFCQYYDIKCDMNFTKSPSANQPTPFLKALSSLILMFEVGDIITIDVTVSHKQIKTVSYGFFLDGKFRMFTS